MKWPKMPEFRFRRVHVERTLIGCSAALVLLLSLQSRNVEREPYEEPLEDIPQAQAAVSVSAQDMQQTVVYYEDGTDTSCPFSATCCARTASPRRRWS